jgi:hypothetical protein
MRIRVDVSSRDAPVDPELLRTDYIIARSDPAVRLILIRHYCGYGTAREKARRMGLCRSIYFERVELAAWHVHVEYDKPDTSIRESQFMQLESRTA